MWALAGLSLSMLLSSLGTSVANVALPTLAQAFAASFQEVQWVVLAYLLAVTVPIVGVGRLGDVLGRRRLLLAGILLFTAASVLCGMAGSLGMLTAARALQGLGAAVMMALTVALVGDAVPEARTGTAMGLLGTMSAIGTALGPSLGGLLVAGIGWRAIFFVNVPLGGLTLLLVRRHLPADRPASGAKRDGFDMVGMLLLAVTLTAYALAMTTGRGHFGAMNVALLLVAFLAAGVFVLAEGRSASPLVRLSTLRDPVLGASFVKSALVSTVMMATLVVGPFYLTRGLGVDVALVGLALSAGPVASALAGVPAGLVVDELGTRRVTCVGLGAMVFGSSVLAVTPSLSGVAAYVAPIVVMTAGYALFQAANNTAIMTHAGPEQRGVIAGMLGLSRNLGLITGASAMGALFAFAAAASDVASARPEAVASGMRVTFAVAAALSAVALVMALGGPRDPMRSDDPRGRVMRAIRSRWTAPAALIALSALPAVMGAIRLREIAGHAAVTPDNARFLAAPMPVTVHVSAVIPFTLLGALQFAPSLRGRSPWHRIVGWLLLPCGLAVALSGLWMTLFYPWPEGDGVGVYAERLLFGSAMLGSLLLALAALRRRDFAAHGAWMTRAYAIGIGAGTQVLTHLPWFLLVDRKPGEGPRTVMMGAAWVINVLVAEWVIRRPPSGSRPPPPKLGAG